MKVGDLVKRIKNWVPHGSNLLGVVMGLNQSPLGGAIHVRVFYFEVGKDYWEKLDWLEVVCK